MDFIELVKQAGIVGAGGAGFPTHVKLAAKAQTFIVNAAECEPLIETDKYLCRTFPDQIVAATAAVAVHLGASRTVIALKAKYKPEIKALEDAITRSGVAIEIYPMKTFYPAGDEQTMVQQVTGKCVPERGLPLDVGAVVDNVGTLLGIYDALIDGLHAPVTHKYLSITGSVREPLMLHVPIGTKILDCIAAAAVTVGKYAIILGGPMMGRVVADSAAIADAVVTKTTGNILVLPHDHYLITWAQRPIERIRTQAKSACIQCRMCTDLCPRYLIGHQIRPHLVMRNLYREPFIKDDEEYIRAFGDAVNCCDCGICEMFSCPMALSPRKVNGFIKGQLRARGLTVARNLSPQAHSDIEMGHVPTERLVARLGLSEYYNAHAHVCTELQPKTVFIPFGQHIGKPAVCVSKVGDIVRCGELLAAAAEGLSANIHASMDGVITEISTAGARICRKEA